MDIDAFSGDLNEAMRHYDFIVERYALLKEKWNHKDSLSERTCVQYISIINKVIPKFMNADNFRNSGHPKSSVDDTLRVMMNEEAKSNGDMRSIRSALRHMVSRQFERIVQELHDHHFPIVDRQGIVNFTTALDKLDMLLKWFEALIVMNFEISNKKSNKPSSRPLTASDRFKIYQHLTENKGRYWAAVVVLFLTGCSPDDVRRGVGIGRSRTSISFGFDYSKKGEGLMRGIGIAVGDPFYNLAEKLKNDHATVNLGGKELWRTSELAHVVGNIGTVIGLKNPISPTSFRHAFASDLQCIGFSRKIIAQGLGYKSDTARIPFVRANRGLKGRKLLVAWSEPGGNWVSHSLPDRKS